MKLSILFALLFVGCAFAQDGEVVPVEDGIDDVVVDPTPTKDPECNSGTTIYNGTVTTTNEEGKTCSALETTCQTKVEVSQDTYRIYRQCQTPEACANNQQSNPQQCYSEEAEEKQEKVCHFCCQGDFCNDGSEIDIVLPTA